MRSLAAFVLLSSALAIAKPSPACSKTCDEAVNKMSAACRQQTKGKEHAEEAKSCAQGLQMIRSTCYTQCAKSEAGANNKKKR
jgi:hypothetical protein